MNREISVLVPLMRAHLIAPLVANIHEVTVNCRVVVIATGGCAEAARDLPVDLIEDEGGTYPVRINKAFLACNEPYVFLGADDLRFHPDWFPNAMRVMDQINGVVAVNDLHNSAGVHFLVSRDYVNEFGGSGDGVSGVVLCESYSHAYVDDEIRAVARSRGKFEFAHDAIVEHMHPGAGKAPLDPVYSLGESSMPQGQALYMSRAHLWGG